VESANSCQTLHSGKDGAKGHRVQAFKDRHYLRREFAELMPQGIRDDPKAWTPPLDPSSLPPRNLESPEAKVVLELGCGVGNSAFPLMVGLVRYTLHSVYPKLESAWFQTLNLKCDILV
jgi:hypothetical protein